MKTMPAFIIVFAIALVSSFSALAAETPYVRMATWPETMLAAREAYQAHAAASSFVPVVSRLMRGKEAAEQAVVNVTGVKRLMLVAEIGPDNYNYDRADWGEPTLYDAAGNATPLRDLEPLSAKVGWGALQRDKGLGNVLDVAGRVFAHGFFAHAPSELVFNLDGKYTRFETWFGIDGMDKNGSVVFKILDPDSSAEELWDALAKDYPFEARALAEDAPNGGPAWLLSPKDNSEYQRAAVEHALAGCGSNGEALRARLNAMIAASNPDDPAWLELYVDAARARERVRAVRAQLSLVNVSALRRAIADLSGTWGAHYPKGAAYSAELDALVAACPALDGEKAPDDLPLDLAERLLALRRDALLANPLLDFDDMLVIKRADDSPSLGLPANWQGNCSLPRDGFRDELDRWKYRDENAALETVFTPETPRQIADLELHWDAQRVLCSMIGTNNRWQIWELSGIGGAIQARQVTPGAEPDVDNYDACYLPDGRIVYDSNATYTGVPCVSGSDYVANLCIMNNDGTGVRELCFEQDHDWCPAVLNNGRILYERWEYSDLPHSNTRFMFHANPDGTSQMEYYGSNSYWPNSFFYARPVPGHPTMIAGIATGHHGVRRVGELVLLDPARGRNEADGAVQRIPGWGKKVEPIVKDQLVDDSWPKFLHPWPLSEKYLIVACQPTAESRWGIYLVDVFDNLLLLKEEPGYALLEPTPVQQRPVPPVIPDRVDPSRKDALVYMADVYAGAGLRDVPRGAVKTLRVISYDFAYRTTGGLLGTVGMDGPWDVKRVLGTVPVAPDGSAYFRVPANTPIAVQPLDDDGKAMQLMRSWFTAMPGETLSCVGCHERQSSPPAARPSVATRETPSEIAPWRGPARGFSFAREVQPVLDAHCLTCHDGTAQDRPDLRGTAMIDDWWSDISGHGPKGIAGKFSVAYAALHKYVRRPGIEGDYHLLEPLEFHADTTELAQMLEKGHHGVKLDAESWDRLVTWIDLNTPYHGTWTEIYGDNYVKPLADRRRELRRQYAGMDEDLEWISPVATLASTAETPVETPSAPNAASATLPDWPLSPMDAKRAQRAVGTPKRSVALPGGLSIELSYIPAGEFIMGANDGANDERPAVPVAFAQPFWMGVCEISNAQFAAFNPAHDSRVESKHGYQFGVHGYPLNEPNQPVVRVTWEQAMAFCDWLSAQTGETFSLPTEAQWEYACRAGSATPFDKGADEAELAGLANVADQRLADFAGDPYKLFAPFKHPNKYDDWIPRTNAFDDNAILTAPVGSYEANAWGLKDMRGNAWEWTRTVYRAYPYAQDGRDEVQAEGKRVVRGGSWYDRPYRATSSFRLAYQPWQRVYNVGFRVVCAEGEKIAAAGK